MGYCCATAGKSLQRDLQLGLIPYWQFDTTAARQFRLYIFNFMMKRTHKEMFYAMCGPLMYVNGLIYKATRAPKDGEIKVHLGPGQRNYLEGWVNVDANMFTGKCDVWADLRNELPFHDDTVGAIYSHHMIEHLPDIAFHCREMFRVLKPGGIIRVGGPNGDSAIRKFVEKDLNWFSTFPDSRASLGGRLENFIFCRQEHLTILTASYLEELMSAAGFVDFTVRLPCTETGRSDIFAPCLALESEDTMDCPHTLLVEARKP